MFRYVQITNIPSARMMINNSKQPGQLLPIIDMNDMSWASTAL